MGSRAIGTVLDMNDDALATFRINSLGPILGIKHAARAMIAQDTRRPTGSSDARPIGGSIIITASVAGLRSGAGRKFNLTLHGRHVTAAGGASNRLQRE